MEGVLRKATALLLQEEPVEDFHASDQDASRQLPLNFLGGKSN